MKYRLKNREFQQELDKLSNGEFSKELQEQRGMYSPRPFIEDKLLIICCDDRDNVVVQMRIPYDEIEEINEYDPNTWNSYPEVTPPEGVLMRVECDGDRKLRTCLVFKNGQWHYESGVRFGNREDGAYYDHERGLIVVRRFRPWE